MFQIEFIKDHSHAKDMKKSAGGLRSTVSHPGGPGQSPGGVILGHIEKAPPLSVICTALKGDILFQDFVYNLHTYFTVHLAMAVSTKQTTRILNLYQTTKHATDATDKFDEMLTIRYHFDSAKCFLKNSYM